MSEATQQEDKSKITDKCYIVLRNSREKDTVHFHLRNVAGQRELIEIGGHLEFVCGGICLSSGLLVTFHCLICMEVSYMHLLCEKKKFINLYHCAQCPCHLKGSSQASF